MGDTLELNQGNDLIPWRRNQGDDMGDRSEWILGADQVKNACT